MTGRTTLLNKMVHLLVDEWGYREVEAALTQLSDAVRGPEHQRLRSGGPNATTQKGRHPAKLLASEQVARARLPEAQEATLRELAMRFDRKQVLPSVSDVREFLIMMGERPGAMKDRSEAFRRLLMALSDLPLERLQTLANTALHSGPSQLGPLSDAISTAAASLPRHREPS